MNYTNNPPQISERDWHIKCGAAILGIYAAIKLCDVLRIDPHDLMRLVENNVPRFEEAYHGQD